MFLVPSSDRDSPTLRQFDDVPMPEFESGQEKSGWMNFFETKRPHPQRVQQWILRFSREKQHEQIVACLQSALVHGQSQPWMYEVLALSMEILNYPKEDVDRVVLSLSDFGAVSFENVMYSAAYLTKFGRVPAALKMFRQASILAPERYEPYLYGLAPAEQGGTNDDLEWTATGVLTHYWEPDREGVHNKAEDALLNRIRKLRMKGEIEAADRMFNALREAKVRDLEIRLEWSGDADLDLIVEEPLGTVCSFETPLTVAGGIHLQDGVGPDRPLEAYLCPRGMTGRYRIQVKKEYGTVVGDRATLTVIRHADSANESVERRTLKLDGNVLSFDIELDAGRREKPRELSSIVPRTRGFPRPLPVSVQQRASALPLTEARAQVLGEWNTANDPTLRRAGAIGFAPVVQTYLDGSALNANAVISADRRYVRIGIAPQFSNITDVFTFTTPGGAVTQTPFIAE